MGKPKKSSTDYDSLKKAGKILTRDGKIKKKIPKQFTSFKCKTCKKKFTNSGNLATHEKIHMNEEYPCSSCSYVAATKKYLARHIKQTHKTPTHTCHVCGKAFHHPCSLKEHIMIHTGEKPYKCTYCEKSFRVSYSLNSHLLIHKNEKPFKCSFCEYACRDSSTLRKHEQRHMGIIRKFSCKICPKKFNSKPLLKYHVEEVHLDYLELDLKKFKCEHCGKTFQLRNNMLKHVEVVHNSTQKCSCPICGKRVKHKIYLASHLRSHLTQRPYSCGYTGCGKTFKNKGDMKKHSIIHMPHLHHACGKCGATFSREQRLIKHMNTHEPREKNVICDYCNVPTINHSKVHMRHLHHACGKCGATFSREQRLIKPMNTHELREKNVICDYCNVPFYTKNYLIKHINQKHCKNKTHYICDYCGLVTFNKPSLVMHIKYGICRKEKLYCRICKTRYKNSYTLRSHYLKTHKMKYKPIKRIKKEKQPSVEVKVEPVDEDPYGDVHLSPLQVIKEEIDVETISPENDLISYSKHVLSEDLQEYLLKDEQTPAADTFDAFLMQHVFHKQLKDEPEEQNFEKIDAKQEAIASEKLRDMIRKAKEDEAKKIKEKKEKKQAIVLEKKLKREAKIMRRKKRMEKYELERVRLMYNERMKKAATVTKRKEPAKKITYYKKKTVEDTNSKEETEKTDGISSNDKNKPTNDHDVTKYVDFGEKECNNGILDNSKGNNSLSDVNINIHNDTSVRSIDVSNNNEDVSNGIIKHLDLTKDLNAVIDSNLVTESDRTKNVSVDVEIESLNDINQDPNVITNDNECNSDNIIKEKDVESCANGKINSIKENSSVNDQEKSVSEENDRENANNSESSENRSHGKENDANNKENATEDETKDIEENDASSNDEKSDSDSDYEPSTGDEIAPNKKMKFQTFQCYICFKLFPTKEELLSHCEIHFDICNSITLSKCPVCGHVVSRNLEAHMRKKHDMHVTIPHNKLMTNNDESGSKYCYKMADTVLEIIPSVKMLNHRAAVEIDKKNRERKDKTVAKAKLVKKGDQWILEKVNVDISFQELPEFTDEELKSLPVSSDYTDRLGQLGKLARRKGVRIMFPCDRCDKICQNFSALKLHSRRHDPNKKPFAPKIYKRNCKAPPVPKEKPVVTNLEHRAAKPKPIKNKHKCDEKLKKFYETHIRGADIEFWQFLKIYNKMERENIRDFEDFEGRVDFGIHTNEERINNDPKTSNSNDTVKTKQLLHTEKDPPTNKLKNKKSLSKASPTNSGNAKINNNAMSQKVSSKLTFLNDKGIRKPAFKRVVMISRKQHLERQKAKLLLREKLKGNV